MVPLGTRSLDSLSSWQSPRRPAASLSLWSLQLLLLLAVIGSGDSTEHPCQLEVSSACPERPSAEVGRCLKEKSEHETPTSLSSECTDFLALNLACADTISKNCDEAFFSRDTVLCLTSWVDQASLSSKCRSVMRWAIPREEAEDEEAESEGSGMSAEDYEEKEAWRARHKASRSAAIERMSEAQREKKRKELERLKEEDPEEYRRVVEEEERRQKEMEEQKKRDRKLQAALERKRREELGLGPEDDESGKYKGTRRRSKQSWFLWVKNWVKQNWLFLVLGLILLAYLAFNVLNLGDMFGRGREDSDDSDEEKKD